MHSSVLCAILAAALSLIHVIRVLAATNRT